MRLLMICGAATWLTCGALACGGSPAPIRDPAQNQASVGPPTRGAGAVNDERETQVELSDEVRAECRVSQVTADSPRFELDESTLRGPEKNMLDDVASCLKEGPLQKRTITIVGRTDPRGSAEHNQNLGANRAEATRNYLIARGVPEGRLLVVSRGEERREAALAPGQPGANQHQRLAQERAGSANHTPTAGKPSTEERTNVAQRQVTA